MKNFLANVFEGTIYCIVFIILVIVMEYSHNKEVKKINKEKDQIELKLEQYEIENKQLRIKLKQQNNANYQLLMATINEIQILKQSNEKLTKEVNELLQKQKELEERKINYNHVQLYYGNRKS